MKLQEDFKAFIDGELSIMDRHTVTKHLETNEADRKAVEELRQLSRGIREYVTKPEPAGLEQTLAALANAKPKTERAQLMVLNLRWVGIAAACMLMIGFVGHFLTGSRGDADMASSSASNSVFEKRVMNDTAASPKAANDAPVLDQEKAPAIVDGAAGKGGFAGASSFGTTKGMAKAIPQSNGKIMPSVSSPAPSPPPAVRRGVQPLVQKDASLTVKVKSVAQAQQNVETMVVGLQGFVQQSNRNETEGQDGQATMSLRVPVQQFDTAVKEIRALGDVVSETSSGNDVTSNVVDMDARLRVLRAEESDYLVLLRRARRTGEIMEIKDKLTEIRTEIESIVGQENTTKDMAAYSTINVTLTQKPLVGQIGDKTGAQDAWLSDTWATAINGLSAAGRLIGQLLIFVLVWSPIWVPTALIGAWIYRKARW